MRTAVSPQQAVSTGEFIALIAMLMATIAFSIDSMLPALSEIGADLTPDAPNKAQLIITSFVLGMGAGTFFTGPLSDRFGRKPVMMAGAAIYIMASLVAWRADTLSVVLAARVVQGIGAAAPRVVAMALVRDKYSGRQMARITSFAMLIFSLVPAFAPSIGKFIMDVTGWRGIFLSFVVFSAISVIWLGLRQPETLAPGDRRPLKLSTLWSACQELFNHPTVRTSIIVQVLIYGILFSTLSSTQQIFSQTYGEGASFHLWFGGIAIIASSASFINARLVVKMGMRPIIKAMCTAQIFLSTVMVIVIRTGVLGDYELYAYALWCAAIFFQIGMTLGNLTALAMEPMGHIAGVAASMISAISTIGAVIIAVPVGLAFDGTALPLAIGVFCLSCLALFFTTKIRREGDELKEG